MCTVFFPILNTFLAAGLSLSLASPLAVPQRRDTSTACAGAPAGSLENASNIKLLAYNTTGSDTSVGTPLVVPDIWKYHQNEGLRLALGTSEPYNDDPYLDLLNGSLLVYPKSGDVGKPAAASTPLSSSDIELSKPVPAQPGLTVCAVLEGGKAVLAVNGDADSWSLCRSTGNLVTAYPFFVVYRPTTENDGSYVFGECYSIQIGVEFASPTPAGEIW